MHPDGPDLRHGADLVEVIAQVREREVAGTGQMAGSPFLVPPDVDHRWPLPPRPGSGKVGERDHRVAAQASARRPRGEGPGHLRGGAVDADQGHGPLGAAYPQSGWDPSVPGIWEGDTPSFLYLVSAVHGLNDPEKPDQPSWGGKFVRKDPSKNHWFDDPAGWKTVWQWRADVQADFARRADWMLP